MPTPVPDFGALAQQQTQANDEATRRTTWAQRPDQYGPMGSSTWNQMPDGRWVQNSSLSGAAQGLFDASLGWQSSLGSQVGAGAPQASFGADQRVIDAWNALQQPALDKEANAARARAAAMGLTLGSNASNDIERTIGANAATSRNQGILQGVNAARGLYQDQLAGYQANVGAMGAMTGVRDSLNPNKWQSEIPTAAAYVPQSVYQSGVDVFNAQRANENAAQMSSQATTDSYINALRAAGGISGVISGAKDLYGVAKDIYNWF